MTGPLKDVIYSAMRERGFKMHPGGFYQLNIDSGASELHIWPLAEDTSVKHNNFIHDHNYHLRSMTLIGGLKQEGYRFHELPESDEKAAYQLFESQRAEMREFRSIAPTGKFGYIENNLIARMQDGEVHDMTENWLHKSTPDSTRLTATLIKKMGQNYNPTRIVVERGKSISGRDLILKPTEQKIASFYLDQVLGTLTEDIWDDAERFIKHERKVKEKPVASN